MNILYIGDLFGNDSVTFLEKNLSKIKQDYKVNIVIVNAENVTNGKGLALRHYNRLKKLGIACFSMGNHTFSNSEIFDYIEGSNVIRPANIPGDVGKGYYVFKYNDKKICVINLMGRVFYTQALDCPFKTLENILINVKADYYIVDMHAETTSEKIALAMDFDGKVDAIVGTHTHVQTADEEVYNNTCYITDMGMCGPKTSVLGDDKDEIINRFRTGVYDKLVVAKTNEFIINGVILDFGINNKISRINKKIKL